MASTESTSSPSPSDAPWPSPNGITGTYDMHCHCGAIRWTMKLSPPLYEEEAHGKERWTAVDCNCSHCERKGMINVHPLADDVTFTQGAEHRQEYRFASKQMPHWFCSKCGSTIGTDLSNLMVTMGMKERRFAINVRMLKNFDMSKILIKPVTFMKNKPPKYEI